MPEFLNCGRAEVCSHCRELDEEQRLSACFVVRTLMENDGEFVRVNSPETVENYAAELLRIAEGEYFTQDVVRATVVSAEELTFN